MKIKLNKKHLNHKAGDEIEVTAEESEYFRRMGMITEGVLKELASKGVVDNIVKNKKNK